MKQMQGLDAAFVAMEQPNAPIHIGSMLIYDPSTAPGGFVRFKDILSFIDARLQLAPSMRQKMVKVPFGIDYPYWIEDPDFDLEYHVRHVALPKPGDWRQLCILSSRLFARPLDLNRPPWEMTVVEGLDNVDGVPEGSYATITKVHHAAIDGVSGVDMMQATHSLGPDTPPPDTPDMWKPEKEPSQIGMFMRGYVRGFANPLRQMDAARKSVPGMYRAAKGFAKGEFDFDAVGKTPRTRFNKTVSAHRTYDGKAFDLNNIKQLRVLSEGCKINDVMLAIVGGAMRAYLETHCELPEESLTAMAPISVRDDSEKNAMGNQVSAMAVPLGTHIADPVERLQYIHAETLKSKAMTTALGARQMTEMSKLSPALYMGLGARLYSQFGMANRIKPMFNTVVTNVPGPPIPLYSAGAKLVGLYGQLCLMDGLGIGHVVHSYTDEITVGVIGCRTALPDPANYVAHLQDTYDELCKAAGIRKAKAKKPASAKAKASASASSSAKKTARNKKAETAA